MIMDTCIFHLLLFMLFLKHATPSGELEIRFVKYDSGIEKSITRGNDCCEDSGCRKCIYQFHICITMDVHGIADIHGITDQLKQYCIVTDDMTAEPPTIINFYDTLNKNTKNPWRIPIDDNILGNFKMDFEIRSKGKLFDRITGEFDLSNATSVGETKNIQVINFYQDIRRNKREISFEVSGICNKNFLSPDCMTSTCVNTDDVTGHFRSDVKGNTICLDGWKNVTTNCTQRNITSSSSLIKQESSTLYTARLSAKLAPIVSTHLITSSKAILTVKPLSGNSTSLKTTLATSLKDTLSTTITMSTFRISKSSIRKNIIVSSYESISTDKIRTSVIQTPSSIVEIQSYADSITTTATPETTKLQVTTPMTEIIQETQSVAACISSCSSSETHSSLASSSTALTYMTSALKSSVVVYKSRTTLPSYLTTSIEKTLSEKVRSTVSPSKSSIDITSIFSKSVTSISSNTIQTNTIPSSIKHPTSMSIMKTATASIPIKTKHRTSTVNSNSSSQIRQTNNIAESSLRNTIVTSSLISRNIQTTLSSIKTQSLSLPQHKTFTIITSQPSKSSTQKKIASSSSLIVDNKQTTRYIIPVKPEESSTRISSVYVSRSVVSPPDVASRQDNEIHMNYILLGIASLAVLLVIILTICLACQRRKIRKKLKSHEKQIQELQSLGTLHFDDKNHPLPTDEDAFKRNESNRRTIDTPGGEFLGFHNALFVHDNNGINKKNNVEEENSKTNQKVKKNKSSKNKQDFITESLDGQPGPSQEVFHEPNDVSLMFTPSMPPPPPPPPPIIKQQSIIIKPNRTNSTNPKKSPSIPIPMTSLLDEYKQRMSSSPKTEGRLIRASTLNNKINKNTEDIPLKTRSTTIDIRNKINNDIIKSVNPRDNFVKNLPGMVDGVYAPNGRGKDPGYESWNGDEDLFTGYKNKTFQLPR